MSKVENVVYYGTKKLKAQVMDREEYCTYRGWELPDDESGDDSGYLVEYLDGGAPNDDRHAGYISWSPRDVFDAAYQPLTKMNFSHALAAIKEGKRLARHGWNGKDMLIYLKKGSVASNRALEASPSAPINNEALFDKGDYGTVTRLPAICMKTAQGDILEGWLASQTDLMAEDWFVVD